MKTIRDQLTGHDISIDYNPSSAVAIMACNGKWETETIPKGSRSMAQVAYTKGDIEAFGSFFNEDDSFAKLFYADVVAGSI